jgi:hypothetical protein
MYQLCRKAKVFFDLTTTLMVNMIAKVSGKIEKKENKSSTFIHYGFNFVNDINMFENNAPYRKHFTICIV